MTLDQLEVFKAIIEEGGLRAAANKLNKSQPALTVSLRNLEEKLGLQLLDRDHYRLRPTDSGKVVYQKVLKIFKEVEDLETISLELNLGKEPIVNLAIDLLCPTNLILKLVSNFQKNCVGTKINMDFEILGGCEHKILNGVSDIAVTPFVKNINKIQMLHLCNVSLIPCVSKQMANKKIRDVSQIIVKDPLNSHENEITSSNSIIVSDHMIKRQLIINGLGWGHLEETSIRDELKNKTIVEISTSNVKRKILPLYLIKRVNRKLGPIALDLWTFLEDQIKQ